MALSPTGKALVISLTESGTQLGTPVAVGTKFVETKFSAICRANLAGSHRRSIVSIENTQYFLRHARHEKGRLLNRPVPIFPLFTVSYIGSGGGTRTPDTRIMIPLL